MWLNRVLMVQILLALCYGSWAEKVMRPTFHNIKLWSDEKMVSHNFVFDNSDPHMNFTLEVHQALHDVDIHLEARITNKLDPYYTSTLNTTLNVCRILNFANKSPVGRFVYGFIREFGNVIDSCPIAKGSYYINKFWWPEDPTTSILTDFDFELLFSAQHLDASKKRTLIINDHVDGVFSVQDVTNFKPGIFGMLPKRR